MTKSPRSQSATRTVAHIVREWAARIDHDLEALLLKHSSLHYENPNYGDVVIIRYGDYRFNRIKTAEGTHLQSKLRDALTPFIASLRVLLEKRTDTAHQEIDALEKTLRSATEQQDCSHHASTDAVLSDCRESIAAMLGTFETLHDPEEGHTLLVPDTNALLYNHVLNEWSYPDQKRFTLLLVPTVLSELDTLKVTHRNEDVRDKAESTIRQLKDYRKRGSLTVGVPIVSNAISLRAIASEPNMTESLPWLSRDSADDRILASTIEVMRAHPRAAVAIVTRDINLQNKAEVAHVSYIEPPERPVKPAAPPIPQAESIAAELASERHREWERSNALHTKGVALASAEVETLYARLQQIGSGGGALTNHRNGVRGLLQGDTFTLGVSWHKPYENTLNDSVLTVRIFDGDPFPTGVPTKHLSEVASCPFRFDLTETHQPIWRDDRKRAFNTEELITECVKMLTDQMRLALRRLRR